MTLQGDRHAPDYIQGRGVAVITPDLHVLSRPAGRGTED